MEQIQKRPPESACGLSPDFSREVKPMSNRARIAHNLTTLQGASLQELARLTGLPENVVESEVKGLKREVGGIRGSAKKGYTLVKDLEKPKYLLKAKTLLLRDLGELQPKLQNK